MIPFPYPLSPAVRLEPEWRPHLCVMAGLGEPSVRVMPEPLREHGLTEAERMQAYGGGS